MIQRAVNDCGTGKNIQQLTISDACVSDIGTAIADLTNIGIDIATKNWGKLALDITKVIPLISKFIGDC